MVEERVVLVDERDRVIGESGKMAAHQGDGMLHRAISVFLYDDAGRLLLQRRAMTKHHFRGLWGNTCCSHPRPGEGTIEAGERRLWEEMGIRVPLREAGVFTYRAVDPESGLTEHEIDHVLVGSFAGEPNPNPAEVDDWAWVDPRVLADRLREGTQGYVPWLAPAIEAIAPDPLV